MDNDISSLTAYDYGFRIYNPAIARFLSIDPLSQSYPWFTPYQFAGNSPILNIDVDGLENAPTQPNTQGNQVEKPEEFFRNGAVAENKGATVTNKKSWFQRAWSFTKKEIFPRAVGALKAVVGTSMVFGGAMLMEFGVGGPIAFYGADLAQSGARQTWDGDSHATLTNQALVAAGVSQESADHIEAVAGIAAGNEVNTTLSSPTLVSRTGVVSSSEMTVLKPPIKEPIIVTEELIHKALEGSTMQTLQGKVSLPMVQRYVTMLEGKSVAPAIKVADGIIVDGNHRYVAGRILGIEPVQVPSSISATQKTFAVPMSKTKIDLIDWDPPKK